MITLPNPEPRLTQISREMKRRLSQAFPSVPIYEGSGGVWGVWTQMLPCIHLFELMATYREHPRGIYTVHQPFQFEYITKLKDRINMYQEGRIKSSLVQKALELDEFLVQNKGMDNEGPALVTKFSITFQEIVEVIPNTLDCALQYELVYTDRFYGYNPSCC